MSFTFNTRNTHFILPLWRISLASLLRPWQLCITGWLSFSCWLAKPAKLEPDYPSPSHIYVTNIFLVQGCRKVVKSGGGGTISDYVLLVVPYTSIYLGACPQKILVL